MRTVVGLALIPLTLASCGGKYRPEGPAMSGYERSFQYPVHRPHDGLVYAGKAPALPAPPIPVLAFGAAFDLDFVVMPREGDFEMIEFARLATPDRHVWLAMETAGSNGDQTLLANMDDIESFMPEIPLARQSVNLQATDRSTEFTVDVSLSYSNSKGQKVEADLTGDPPTKEQEKRNGKTFTHSQNALLAVVDIPASESLFKADVRVDGKGLGLKKIAGFVPAQFVVEQAQGGLVSGAFKIVPGSAAAGGAEFGTITLTAASTGGAAESTTKPPPELLMRMGVAKNFPSIQECWTTRTEAEADLKGGRMQFDWKINAGVVSDSKAAVIEADDALVDKVLQDCVLAAMATWSFDNTVTGSASWPFTFVAGDNVAGTDPMVKIGDGAAELEAPPAPAPVEAPANPEAPGDVPDDPMAEPEAGPASPANEAQISNFTTIHTLSSGSVAEMKWLVTRQGDRVSASQSTDLRTLNYNYRLVQGNYLELVSITVEQYGRATPVTAVTFNPPLPDTRWPFSGKRTSSFVIDVNGQQNYAFGEASTYWTEAGPKIRISPTAPDWAASRPLLTSIIYAGDGTADVKIERVGE